MLTCEMHSVTVYIIGAGGQLETHQLKSQPDPLPRKGTELVRMYGPQHYTHIEMIHTNNNKHKTIRIRSGRMWHFYML